MIIESCPKNCSCSLNRKSRRTSVNCAEQGLTQIPSNLPMLHEESDGIILHLENNLLTNLTESFERLSSLNLSNLPVLLELHMSGNKLSQMDYKLLPDKLEFLGLDNNNLKYYSNQTIQYFRDQVKHSNLSLRLGNNPYDCNCNSLELHHFVKSFYSHIEDFNRTTVKCLETKELFLLNEVDFCSMKPQLLTAMIPIVFIFFVILFLLICQIFYKETILIWVFSKSWGKIFFSEELVDKNKPHDAFLSYSHHDSEFVEKNLLPGLESDDNPKEFQYKCLIHTRDWNVGEMITDQIVESVESSRRTIIVLSKGYIQSMWTKMEFKTAHNKALRDNTQRVVIILHGEKPTKQDLDEDLQKYLTTNTFIDSEDPWFWKKLRYALPKKSRKQKQKLNDLSDISTVKVNNRKAAHLSIHDKLSYNQNQDKNHDSKHVNKNTPQLPYNTQLSRELLLSSESLERNLEGTEYIV